MRLILINLDAAKPEDFSELSDLVTYASSIESEDFTFKFFSQARDTSLSLMNKLKLSPELLISLDDAKKALQEAEKKGIEFVEVLDTEEPTLTKEISCIPSSIDIEHLIPLSLSSIMVPTAPLPSIYAQGLDNLKLYYPETQNMELDIDSDTNRKTDSNASTENESLDANSDLEAKEEELYKLLFYRNFTRLANLETSRTRGMTASTQEIADIPSTPQILIQKTKEASSALVNRGLREWLEEPSSNPQKSIEKVKISRLYGMYQHNKQEKSTKATLDVPSSNHRRALSG